MKKRLLSFLLAVVMVLGMLPMTTMATGPETAYISVSHDGKYLSGLAHAAVPLSELAQINLDTYGLSDYRYDADGDGSDEITALHLVIYAHTELLGKKWNEVTVSGGPGSIFFETGLFGFADCNMNYYFNGVFPTDAYGTGITADQLVLSDGDFLDYAHFSGWSFYSDSAAGFHYFLDSSDRITHTYTATAGEPLTVTLGRAASDLFNGGTILSHENPSYYIDKDYNPLPIRYGKTLYASDASSAALDANGQTSITFAEAGTYYLWADGGYGYDFAGEVVSSPALATVSVEAAAVSYPVTVTAPAGSTISVGAMRNYYVYSFEEALAVTEDETAGTVTYGFNVPASRGEKFVRVQHPDGVTYWHYTKMQDGTVIDVTADDLYLHDDTHNANTIIRDFSEYELDVADIYINANSKGHFALDVGETFEFNVFRNWHAIEGIGNNKTALPDVSYQVIDCNGNASDIVTIEPDTNNSSVATMTANKEGTAVVLVTYDAMYSTLALRGGNGTNSAKPAFFSAIWPENTGVLVVSVGSDATIETNMTINNRELDAEHDVLYYTGTSGASYTFTPETGCTVSVARSVVGDSMTFNGFTNEGVTVDTQTGAVTVAELTTGSHIIQVEKGDQTAYQVIRAKQTTVVITDSEGNAVTADNPAEPGETITVQFGTLYNPVGKLPTIYNSSSYITAKGEDGTGITGQSSDGSAGAYYLFAWNTELHKISVTIPQTWVSETYSINGGLGASGYGSITGGHRSVTYAEGAERDNDAVPSSGKFGMLPTVVVPVNVDTSVPVSSVTLSHSTAELKTGETLTLQATVLPEDTTFDTVWTSSDEKVAAVTNGIVTANYTGTATITATAGEQSASCTVTVTRPSEYIQLMTGSESKVMSDRKLSEIRLYGLSGTLQEGSTEKEYTVLLDSDTDKNKAIAVEMTALLVKAANKKAFTNKIYFWANTETAANRSAVSAWAYSADCSEPGSVTVWPEWEENTATITVGLGDASAIVSDGKNTYQYKIHLIIEEAAVPEPATYTVTLPSGEGYTAADADGSASPITEGGSYSFTVTVADGYDGTNMTVKANGNTLTATNGIYTISNITADQTITVDGVEEIVEEVPLTWQEVMAKTRSFLIAQANETAPVVNTHKGEWMVLGLARNGLEADFFEDYYDNVAAYVQENIDPATGRLHESKSTDNSRVIVALTALGKDVTDVAGYDLLQGLTDTDYVAKQGVNGPIWALIALDTGSYELPSNAARSNQVTRQWLIEYILGKQLSDGGWALAGNTSDPDMTGMAVQALAPYYDDDDAVKAAVDEAISAMSGMIDRSSPEGCAQIIVALSALGIDCEEATSFSAVLDRMLTYALEDGSFRKSPAANNFNQMSTEQAFYAMVAYDRLKNGDTSLYDMSDVVPSEEEQDAPVQEVIDAIDALTVTRANASTLRKLEKIRTAYQALSPEERALVENYADFEEKAAAFDELLEAAKDDAAEELNAYIEDLEEDDYTEAEWEELEEILSAALRELRSAETTEQINTILSQAQRKMDNLETGDTIRVTFRLIGDSQHDDGVDGHEEYVTWIPTTSYTLKPGATMYDVFTAAISDHGLSQRGASNNYVESIKAPSVLGGYWLSEFDNGPNSGWMYTVNGEHPGTGLKTYDLEDGDRIIWHYTDDYLLEERSSSSKYYYRWLEAEDISPKKYKEEHEDEEQKETNVSADFADVKEGDWFYEDVMYAVGEGLFNGTSATAFSPNASMSRAMLVTVLYRLDGEPAVTGTESFRDVENDTWYTAAVNWATKHKIAGGYGNGQFGPNDPITREQMAAILLRYAQYKNYSTSASGSLSDYHDFDEISDYALQAMEWTKAEGLIGGRTETTLAPKGTATRAEVAAILHRFAENF